jgi:hypothetical protein
VALRRRSSAAAGILVGCAAGFRITNLLFLLPALLYLRVTSAGAARMWRPDAAIMLIVAGLSGVVWYLPFVIASGLGWRYFLKLPVQGSDISLAHHAALAVYNWISICGPLATAAVVSLLVVERHEVMRRLAQDLRQRNTHLLVGLMVLALYGMLTWRFTMKSEYALPALPFALVIVSRLISARGLALVAVLTVSFNVFTIDLKGGSSGRRALVFRPAWGLTVSDWMMRREMQDLRHGIGTLSHLGKAVVLTGMAGTLTADNASLEPSDPHSISSRLPADAGASVHRAAGPTIHRIKNSSVFLVNSLAAADVEQIRRDGYRVYMFSDYAPTAAINGRGYDPYAMGIEVIPIFSPAAFYRPTMPSPEVE